MLQIELREKWFLTPSQEYFTCIETSPVIGEGSEILPDRIIQ